MWAVWNLLAVSVSYNGNRVTGKELKTMENLWYIVGTTNLS